MSNPLRRRWAVTERRADRRTGMKLGEPEVMSRHWSRRRAERSKRGFIHVMASHNASGLGPRLLYTVDQA